MLVTLVATSIDEKGWKMKRVNCVEVNVQDDLDLTSVDGEIAWELIFDHHAIHVCRGAYSKKWALK